MIDYNFGDTSDFFKDKALAVGNKIDMSDYGSEISGKIINTPIQTQEVAKSAEQLEKEAAAQRALEIYYTKKGGGGTDDIESALKKESDVKSFIFAPVGDDRPMRQRYPELKTIPEFQELTDNQLKFVWYYACLSSPLIFFDDDTRLRKSLDYSMKGTAEEGQIIKYLKGDFPTIIETAVTRMSAFSPSLRIQAKVAVQKMFNNTINIISEKSTRDISMMEDGMEKLQMLQVQEKARKELPELLALLEEGFGVIELRKNKDAKDSNILNLMDYVLNEE